MSDLKSKQLAADLLASTLKRRLKPSMMSLWLGVIFPAGTIAFEASSRWCAQAFFDPIPTVWHTLAVSAVPASNLIVLFWLRDAVPAKPSHVALISGFGLGVAALYALIFLPLLPLAVVGVLIYGLGFLAMAPLISFIFALKLSREVKRKQPTSYKRPLIAGLTAAFCLLIALDVPAAATRLGVAWAASGDAVQRERGLTLLRTLGDDDLLLRLCYEATGRPSGLLSALVMLGSRNFFEPEQREVTQSTAEVREIYYRAFGLPFNAKPAPFQSGSWSRFADFQWDADHGGTEVGGRLKGLELVSSRIDGSINAAEAVSYTEWIVEFRNTSPLDREARVQFALPPGGVVSRATLWIDGAEQDATYGGRATVRAAYEHVAVQQRRDPLLVTTKGGDRVLAQAFPVPRNGGTIKFKIGITAPLELDGDGKAHLMLPAIVDRNFSFAADARHSIWLESKSALSTQSIDLHAAEVSPALYRITGSLTDAELANTRPSVEAIREPSQGGPVTARIGMGANIVQSIVMRTSHSPGAIELVIDGSTRAGLRKDMIGPALETIPDGTPVGIVVASEPIAILDIAPWSPAQKAAAIKLFAATHFAGGQDNTPALARALVELEPHENAALLWLHGPQPIAFHKTSGLIEQAASRLVRRPQVWLLPTEPGPNEALPDLPWAWNARSVQLTATHDLASFMSQLFTSGPRLMIELSEAPVQLASEPGTAGTPGSDHIARLWARDRILSLMDQPDDKRRDAVALAAEYHLVTPVSGAVVLQTKQQYDENGLAAPPTAGVPTVPEPEEWAVIILAAIALGWLLSRQRNGPVAA